MSVANLFEGDPRAGEVAGAVYDLLQERAAGWPLPMVVGVLELVKSEIIQDARGA